MAREPRVKIVDAEGCYHLRNRVACHVGEYPLSGRAESEKFVELLTRYSRAYFCQVASYSVMGNHYHIVARFDEPREVDREELIPRMRHLYPDNWEERLETMAESDWERLAERLFDVSEYMRNINGTFAQWYNRIHDRRGHFWAERFKSKIIDTGPYLGNCTLYVELNGVRAGIVERPEDHRSCSAYLRELEKDEWMMPLERIWGSGHGEWTTLQYYRRSLYWTGTRPKEGKAAIPKDLLEQAIANRFDRPGKYLRRCRYFSEGIIVGSELAALELLARLKKKGRYRRRTRVFEPAPGTYTIRNC